MELIMQPTAFTCGQACPAPRQQIIIPRRARTRHKNKLQPQATPMGVAYFTITHAPAGPMPYHP